MENRSCQINIFKGILKRSVDHLAAWVQKICISVKPKCKVMHLGTKNAGHTCKTRSIVKAVTSDLRSHGR